MDSSEPTYPRALSRVWEGFRATFLTWSPPPEPVVTWNRTQRFPRLIPLLRTETVSWLVVIAAFGIGLAAGADRWGTDSVIAWVAGVFVAIPFVLARYNLLLGWRAALLGSAPVAITQVLSLTVGTGFQAIVAVMLPLYTIAVAVTYVRSIGLWAWAGAVLIFMGLFGSEPAIVILGGLLALGTDGIRSRRVAARELSEERERLGYERARRVTVEERARIARELHDVVAHHMSMVAVRAETAPYRIDGLSHEIRAEFAEISTAARASLDEIRSVLTLLRGDEAPRMPQPDLGRVEELVESARRAGADIDLHISGMRRPLRAPVELSGYRILQESLANVTRHTPGESAEVWIDYGDDELTILVSNPSPNPPGPPGHGLAGMKERATAAGGTVDARRRADSRFVVEANLPVEP